MLPNENDMKKHSATYWKKKLISEGWSEGYAEHVAEHLANGTPLPDFLTGATWLPKTTDAPSPS